MSYMKTNNLHVRNLNALLSASELKNLLGTDEVLKALNLWDSAILSHTETLDRLGGDISDMNEQEMYLVLSHLHYTLCK